MLFEEFKGGELLFPHDELSKFNKQIRQIEKTEVFAITPFENQFGVFCKYLESLNRAGLLNNKLYSMLRNKTKVKSLLEAKGIQFQEQIQLEINEEQSKLLQVYNDKWDPVQFEEDDGIVYTPMVVVHT